MLSPLSPLNVVSNLNAVSNEWCYNYENHNCLRSQFASATYVLSHSNFFQYLGFFFSTGSLESGGVPLLKCQCAKRRGLLSRAAGDRIFNLYLASSVHKTGGTDSYIKKGNLKRTPRRYQAPAYAWWAWLETFSPLRATNSKTTYYLLSYIFFSAQYPKRYCEGSHCGPIKLRLNSLREPKTAFHPK